MCHIEEQLTNLLENITVEMTLSNWKESYFDTRYKVVGIPHMHLCKSDPNAYWAALHEIGHATLGHTMPESWDHEARMEIEAWAFVERYSVLRIPPKTVRQWHKDRIKGSFE